MPEMETYGMYNFVLVWIGQAVSMLGSIMTNFGLMYWAWSITGRATALALVGFFAFLPNMIMMPLAGVFVDRWNKKFVMMISDLAAGLSTIAILLIYVFGTLEIWHIYIAVAFAGAFGSFQFPAYSSATTMMVPKRHYARASGMISMAASAMTIAGPPLAAFLIYGFTTLGQGLILVMSIDVVTFIFAISVLLLVKIPNPPISGEGLKSKGKVFKEMTFGFKYIYSRKGLFGLLMIFLFFNLFSNFSNTLLTPMILSRTADNAHILGSVMSVFGVGGLLGGLALAIWGGPKTKIHGITIGLFVEAIFGMILLAFGVGSLTLMIAIWMVGAFIMAFMGPTVGGSSQAIWQSKVPPDVQGKVFSARAMLAMAAGPLGMILSGPLADYVFEPAMTEGSFLAKIFGWYTGTGPGSGMALMFIISGFFCALLMVIAYVTPAIKNVEKDLPDHSVGDED